MHTKYHNKFNYQILFFLISVVVIFTSLLIIIDRRYIHELFIQDYSHELVITANSINYDIRIKTEHVKAMSSRTMIRKELNRWHNGEISIEAVQDYTRDKYRDGAAVYDDIEYAVRYDLAGRFISSYSISDSTEIQPVTEKTLDIQKKGNDFLLYLENEIIHNGVPIGYDCVAFKIPLSTFYSTFLKNVNFVKNPEPYEYEKIDMIEIGSTGFFLTAEVDDSVKTERINQHYFMILKWMILFVVLLVIVSHITIFHFSRGLISVIEELHNRDVRNERYSAIAQVGAGLAHDLNNKFNVIIGYTEILLKKETPEEIHRTLEIIHKTSWEATSVINKLHHFTNSRFCIMSDINAVQYFDRIFNKTGSIFELKLNVDYRISNELVLHLDTEQLESVIHTLFQNSAEARASVVNITLDRKSIDNDSTCTICSRSMKGEWLCIRIHDNGDGFGEDIDNHRLLEPFYTTKGVRHAGLGLSQVYGIIHQHRGHIIINRALPTGLYFELFLPLGGKGVEA